MVIDIISEEETDVLPLADMVADALNATEVDSWTTMEPWETLNGQQAAAFLRRMGADPEGRNLTPQGEDLA
jgi:hypothetical protein